MCIYQHKSGLSGLTQKAQKSLIKGCNFAVKTLSVSIVLMTAVSYITVLSFYRFLQPCTFIRGCMLIRDCRALKWMRKKKFCLPTTVGGNNNMCKAKCQNMQPIISWCACVKSAPVAYWCFWPNFYGFGNFLIHIWTKKMCKKTGQILSICAWQIKN